MILNEITLPTSFYIFAQKIEVKMAKDLSYKTGHAGEARYRTNEIVLQTGIEGVPRPKSGVEETFFHEVVHILLNQLGEHELNDREEFVERMGAALHQVMATSEGLKICATAKDNIKRPPPKVGGAE